MRTTTSDGRARAAHAEAGDIAAWGALLLWVGAALIFGAALDGFSHKVHPIALLGARGVPRAWMFDVLGFVLPGVLAAWASWHAGRRMEGAGVNRIGGVATTLCAIAGIAFAAQGLLPLDANAARIGDAVGRMHAAAWTVWWIAFAAGAIAGAKGWVERKAMRVATLVAMGLVLGFALFIAVPGAPAMGQRIATLAWLGWVVLVSRPRVR